METEAEAMGTLWGLVGPRTLIPVFASRPLGTPQRRGSDAVPGQKALLWRVQVSQVQKKMDEWKLLGQHGAGVHQVPHQRVPAQAGEPSLRPDGWAGGRAAQLQSRGWGVIRRPPERDSSFTGPPCNEDEASLSLIPLFHYKMG